MNMMMTLLASLLRIGGALAGVMAVYLIPDAILAEGLATAGIADQVSIPMARTGLHVVCGLLGFVIVSQIVGLALRGPRTPPGTRKDAAEAVPRLRRHLVDGSPAPTASSIPSYLDPNPEPTEPVGVSFKELGLEHPHVSEYPAPGGEASGDHDDFAYRNDFDRPESAGSASDEWADPTPEPVRSAPPPRQAPESDGAEPAEVEPVLFESQSFESAPTVASEPEIEREVVAADAAADDWFDAPTPGPEIEREPHMPQDIPHASDHGERGPAPFAAWSTPEAAHSEPQTEAAPNSEPAPAPWPRAEPAQLNEQFEPQAAPEPIVPEPQYAPPAPQEIVSPTATGHDEYNRPSFALPSAGGDADWYDGAGDEEEDADDDGAGYGSLASIGLGKNHAPKVDMAPRGEAGLPPTPYAPGPSSLVPKGKPQDFRLREALAELQRLDQASQ